jgi:hypothetical protein
VEAVDPKVERDHLADRYARVAWQAGRQFGAAGIE